MKRGRNRHGRDGKSLVTPMSCAFEPVSVTPWSASAPRPLGRDSVEDNVSSTLSARLPARVGATLPVRYV